MKLTNYTETQKTFSPFLSSKLVPSQKAIEFRLRLNVIQKTVFPFFPYLPSLCIRSKNHNYCFCSFLLLKDIQFSFPYIVCPSLSRGDIVRFQKLPRDDGLLLIFCDRCNCAKKKKAHLLPLNVNILTQA